MIIHFKRGQRDLGSSIRSNVDSWKKISLIQKCETRIVFQILWINWNEGLILRTQSHPLLISILISFRLQKKLAMNQVRLWSMTNMECSFDCSCFRNKRCSSKYIVLIFPFIPVYSCLVSRQKWNLCRRTQLVLRS